MKWRNIMVSAFYSFRRHHYEASSVSPAPFTQIWQNFHVEVNQKIEQRISKILQE